MTLVAIILFALACCAVGMVQAQQPQVVLKPLSWIKSRGQPRKAFTQPELEALGQSLKNRQLQPLVCLKDGSIICGERRYRAAQLAGLTHLEVKVIEEELTETQIRVLQLVENMQRQDLTPQEQVHGCIDLMAINPDWTRKTCAAHLHFDPSSISKFLSYLDGIPSLKKAFDDGRIGLRDLNAIAALPKEQQQGLLNLKLSSDLSAAEIEAQSRKARNGKPLAAPVGRIRCLVPGKNATLQIIGASAMSLEEMIEAAQEWVKRAKKAADLGWNCKTLERALLHESKKGG